MSAKPRIYISDDEPHICSILQSFLAQAGYEVAVYLNGLDLLDAHRQAPADLLIIDIMMPKMDGFTLCEKLREESSVPIIMVSALDKDHDKIRGLRLGSDDYLTKPFSPVELVARVDSLLRRVALDRIPAPAASTVTVGDLCLNTETFKVLHNGASVNLTGMEFNLLLYLVVNRHRAVGRTELLDKVWGFESHVETRATDDMIKRIRKKLHTAGSVLKIETVWGYGFKISEV